MSACYTYNIGRSRVGTSTYIRRLDVRLIIICDQNVINALFDYDINRVKYKYVVKNKLVHM